METFYPKPDSTKRAVKMAKSFLVKSNSCLLSKSHAPTLSQVEDVVELLGSTYNLINALPGWPLMLLPVFPNADAHKFDGLQVSQE